MIDDLNVWCEKNGYVTAAWAGNGKIVAVLPAMFNWQIIVGDEYGIEERYSYSNSTDAHNCLAEFELWKSRNFEGEPEGWIRHQPSNRRRTNGDPATEYIRP